MTRRAKIIGGIVLLALIGAVGGWYYASPGLTVKAMVEAARDGNEKRFSSYVDYEALRADMKAELTSRLNEETKRDGSAEAKLGLAMGMAMMGPVVDSMVSPKGMSAAFATLAKDQDADKAATGSGSGAAGGGKAKAAVPADPEIHRQGLNRFVVTGKGESQSGLVFERRGFGWKLAGIDLPPMPAKAAAR